MIKDRVDIIAVSGGKDSLATCLVAKDRGTPNVKLVFADTGHEHPHTYEYIDYLERKLDMGPIRRVKSDFSARIEGKRRYIAEHWPKDGVPQDKVDRALELLKPTGNPMLDACLWKGRFPSTRRRFCTQYLKHEPIDKQVLIPALAEHAEVYLWQGIRRDESAARSKLETFEDHPTLDGLTFYRPILDYSADDVFMLADIWGIKPNPLYKMGMARVGCMPCIHSVKDEIRNIAARVPEAIERLEAWEKLISEVSKTGVSVFMDARNSARYLDDPIIATDTHGIRTYVKWSNTKRGGKVPAEPTKPETCSSIYGLCE